MVEERFKHKKYLSLFCRAIGNKGTGVDLIPKKEGLVSYFGDANNIDVQGGTLTWEELEDMIRWAKKKKLYIPNQ